MRNNIIAHKGLLFVVVLLLIGALFTVINIKNTTSSQEVMTQQHTIAMQEHSSSLSWPKEEGCSGITISTFEKANDEKPTHSVSLESQEQMGGFFKELRKLNPQGGGLMVSFVPGVAMTRITFHYSEGKEAHVSVYGDNIQTRDTSFYTDQDDIAKQKEFIGYLNELLK